jgi:hypothetical protein
LIVVILTPNESLVDAINVVGVSVEAIVTSFVLHVEVDHDRAHDAGSEPQDIDRGK